METRIFHGLTFIPAYGSISSSYIYAGGKLYTLFEKTSTRTYLFFAAGIAELGGIHINQLWKDSNFVLGDPVSEFRYVCRNVDIIMARLIKNETVELFGRHSTVPLINGCEISRSVADRHMEYILDQAENRRHAEKALMVTLLNS